MKFSVNHFMELLFLLVQKELKIRYKSSFLGYLWAMANPFAFAVVYYFAFKVIMRVQMPNYSLFLLAGMFPWVWFTNALSHATGSYRNNASLVKKVNLQRSVLPLSNVMHEMVHFCLAIPVLLLFILIAGGDFYLSWFWQIPLMIMLQVMLIYPLALVLALANVYVHDVEYLVGISLSLLFFLTPIVYPLSMVPVKYHALFEMSPITMLIQNWRDVFLEGNLNLITFSTAVAIATIFIVIAWFVYGKTSSKLGELL